MYPYFADKNESLEKRYFEKKDLDDIFDDKDDKDDIDDRIDKDDFRRYIIEGIEEAIKEQGENSRYYEKLYNLVKGEKDKNILRQISLSEMKYEKIFRDLYKILTGKEPKIIIDYGDIDIHDSLSEELYDSIEEQLDDIEFFRMLMSVFADLPIRDMIYEVIVGKQKNAQLLSNLYNKYK